MTERLLAFYGDDFTGSSAVMEVLEFAGVPTVMFLEPPEPEDLARFPNLAAMGIAGVARSRDPQWMATNLPAAFESLNAFGAPINHYKVCSTFDSSPTHGSIGAAIDIGAPILGGRWHPLVVGAPAIGRYQAFGNLFAGIDGDVHRLDRHPVMSQHPVTPMHEADVRRHLSLQTERAIGLVDIAAIRAGQADEALAAQRGAGAEVIAIDVIDDETLEAAGRLAWNDGLGPVFAIGSQGIEYALVSHWRKLGLIANEINCPSFEAVDQIFCVSGSCSPITAAQLDAAQADGFMVIDLDPSQAVGADTWGKELDRVRTLAFAGVAAGDDVIVATSRGPADSSTARLDAAIAASGTDPTTVHDRLGSGLGMLVAQARRDYKINRAVVAGGDTSGHAMTALGAKALSALAPLAPGAPLCTLHADDSVIDGLQVSLKGGQMGSVDFFVLAKTGVPKNSAQQHKLAQQPKFAQPPKFAQRPREEKEL